MQATNNATLPNPFSISALRAPIKANLPNYTLPSQYCEQTSKVYVCCFVWQMKTFYNSNYIRLSPHYGAHSTLDIVRIHFDWMWVLCRAMKSGTETTMKVVYTLFVRTELIEVRSFDINTHIVWNSYIDIDSICEANTRTPLILCTYNSKQYKLSLVYLRQRHGIVYMVWCGSGIFVFTNFHWTQMDFQCTDLYSFINISFRYKHSPHSTVYIYLVYTQTQHTSHMVQHTCSFVRSASLWRCVACGCFTNMKHCVERAHYIVFRVWGLSFDCCSIKGFAFIKHGWIDVTAGFIGGGYVGIVDIHIHEYI